MFLYILIVVLDLFISVESSALLSFAVSLEYTCRDKMASPLTTIANRGDQPVARIHQQLLILPRARIMMLKATFVKRVVHDEDTSGGYIYKVRGLPGQMRIVKFRVRGERN